MGATAAESTRIQLCGRLSIELDGVQHAGGLRGRQVRMLLAYLVLNRTRPVAREELIEALWGASTPKSHDAALRTLLSRLRSAIGGEGLSGRDQVILTLREPVWVDLEAAGTELARAQDALERGDARRAWGLAQVPLNIASRGLLAGMQAVWLESPRRDLDELRLQALEVIGAAGLRMGTAQAGSVERAARTLIDSEPYRESGYVLLMDAIALRGNVAEGLRVFETLRALLRDELGTTPSPEALAAHERLLHPRGGRPEGPPEPDAVPVDIALPSELRARAQSPLIGRGAEMGELARMWDAATQGRLHELRPGGPDASAAARGIRQIVVLSGDAGIGKTSLAAELARRAHEAGGVVLAGHSREEGLAPYEPFLESLRHYFASVGDDDLVPAVREYGPELAGLIPELRGRLAESAAVAPADPDADRYRLFEAFVGLLTGIAERAPILLLLDDLHWADRPTLLLLRHLARAREPARLLILIAYRTEPSEGGLIDALADLHREGLLTQLQVGGLAERETRELIRLRTGERPSQALVDAVQEASEGNPFFVEEIVRGLVAAGVRPGAATASDVSHLGVPEGIKRVISRRLARLDDGTIEWLRVAAVMGREFDPQLLEQVVGFEEERFLAALEEALEAGVLLESETGLATTRYSFSHALVQEALYEGMSGARRASIHRRVGEALEARGDAGVSMLALHFTRGADRDNAAQAIAYARQAGAQAEAMLVHDEAAEHYALALEVLERFAQDEAMRLDLLLSMGEALVRAGERQRAWAAFREAAALAEHVGDSEALARAAIGATRRYVQQPGTVETELIEMLERALALTHEQVSLTRVRLLTSLCGALFYAGDHERINELSAEAKALARRLGDPLAQAYAGGARRRALWNSPSLSERLRISTEMLSFAREAGGLELQLQAHAWLVTDLLAGGDRDGVDAQIQSFHEGAMALRQPLYMWQAAVWAAMEAGLDGALERAEELASDALAVGSPSEGITAPQYHAVQMFMIRREQRRLAELESSIGALADDFDLLSWRAALALLWWDTGEAERARDELGVLLAEQHEGPERHTDWLMATVLLAELSAEAGEGAAARTLYDVLTPYAELNYVAGVGAVCLGPVNGLLGRLAIATGSAGQAREHLEHALTAGAALRSALWTAHAQLDLAAALGHGLRATRLIDDAAEAAARLGLARVADRAAVLRRR